MPEQTSHTRAHARWMVHVALAVVAAIGIWAMLIRFSEGLGVTNLTQFVPWGFWVAFYIYFIGLSAGSFLLSTLIYVFGVKRLEEAGRLALLQALLCMLLAIWMILVDLGHPERFYKVITSMNPTSVLAWEALFYTLYIAIIVAELYFAYRADFVRWGQGGGRLYRRLTLGHTELDTAALARDARWLLILGAIGIPTAIAVHGGTGALFAVAKARPNWFGGLFPIIFLVSALASGGALLTFLTAAFSRLLSDRKFPLVRDLARLSVAILLLDLLLLASEVLVTFYGGVPQEVVGWSQTMFGPYWWVFWFLQLGLGAVVPIWLVFGPLGRTSTRWLGTAGFLMAFGIIGTRLNIVIPPLFAPAFEHLPEAYHDVRFTLGYTASINEWLVLLGTIALGIWLFLAAVKVLRIGSEGREGA